MTKPYWTLSQAMTWIATRSETEVEEAPRELVLVMTHTLFTDPDNTALPDAREVLWGALFGGELAATGIAADLVRHPIQQEKWKDFEAILHHRTERLQRPGIPTGEMFEDVIVAAKDVRRLWPADGSPAVTAPAAGNARPSAREQIAALVREHWPIGQPAGLTTKDWITQIMRLNLSKGGSTLSARTIERAIALSRD